MNRYRAWLSRHHPIWDLWCHHRNIVATVLSGTNGYTDILVSCATRVHGVSIGNLIVIQSCTSILYILSHAFSSRLILCRLTSYFLAVMSLHVPSSKQYPLMIRSIPRREILRSSSPFESLFLALGLGSILLESSHESCTRVERFWTLGSLS